MKRRYLSLILTVIMCFAMMPFTMITASAVTKSVSTAEELKAALEYSSRLDIVLTNDISGDINPEDGFIWSRVKGVKNLDLAGHNIDLCTDDGDLLVLMNVTKGASLSVSDSTDSGAKITYRGYINSNGSSKFRNIIYVTGGTFNLYSGSIIAGRSKSAWCYYHSHNVRRQTFGDGIIAGDNSTVNIYGGLVEGRGYHPDTSGTASAEYPYADCYAIRAISTSAKVNIYEGEFGGYGCTNAIGYETEKNFYIAGGHFKTSRLDETRINGKCLTISGTWITGVQQSMIDTLSKISCSSTEGLQGSTEVTVYKADPTLTFTTIPRVIVGKAFSMDLKGVGSGDLTYSITSGSLPSGLSLNIYTGIISGTPTPSAATSQFTVRVTDPAGAYTERTLYTVVEANDSYITSNESFTGKEGEFFAEHLTIDTEYAEVESMKLEKGPLPPGMSYSYSGQGMAVSGTPTAAGSYSVVFRIVRCDDYKTVYHTVNIVIEPKAGTVNLVNVVADWNDDCTKLANYSTYTKGCKITKVQYAKQRKEIFSCVPGDTIDLAFTVELESGYVFGTNCHTSWKGSAETARIEGATDRTKRFVYTLTVPHPESGISSFNDVSPSAYYADAVEWAVANGITNGTSATTFSPDAICTRAQVVTFLWRAVGKPAPTKKTNPFTDVKSNEYYYDAVLWAVEKGITSGMSATEFAPNSPCTRGQVVTFQWRAAGKPSPTSWNNPFTDVKSSAYYYNAVLWAVEKGITNGQDSTTFAPDKSCTRGQIVTFLYRQYK